MAQNFRYGTRCNPTKHSSCQKTRMIDLSYGIKIIYVVKTTLFGLHFCRRKYPYIFNHFTQSAQKATEFGEITQPLGLLCRSRSLKVTEFGTNRKVICDFLLVINSNLPPILHRFGDILLEKSKIAIFGFSSSV